MITNTTITKMTAEEFTREYFKKHSNVELLEKGLVGTDYWYEVMEAYAKHENAKLKKLLKSINNIIDNSMTLGELGDKLDRKVNAIKRAIK